MSSQVLILRKLAVWDDTASNLHILSGLAENDNEASNFWYSTEETESRIEDNQIGPGTIGHTLDVRVLPDSSAATNLQTIVDNERAVFISVLGIDGGVLMGDIESDNKKCRLSYGKRFDGTVEDYKIMATKRGPWGYDTSTGQHSAGVWAGRNLLLGYEWGDADSDNIADGWSATGFTSTTFASGTQTLEADTTQRDFERAIFFPFEGEEITFSIGNDARSGTYATEQIEIEFRDTADAVISSQTSTFSSTGRKSVTATTPSGSNLLKVVCRFSIQASSATVTSDVSDPALLLGSDSTYTAH